jgi:hypothetical protein
MKTDSLGRRVRTGRQPTGRKVRLMPRDIEILAFLHRHGGRLPTSYIASRVEGSHYVISDRLKLLHHELKLIERPFQQFETLDPRWNELVHQISPLGLEVLKEHGLYSEKAPSMAGAFKHQVMLSCLSASFELGHEGYIPQHAVVKDDLTFNLDGDRVTPDEVFMLKIDGKELLLFLEIDRGTEATASQNFNRKSWTRSIRQYRQIIGKGLHKEKFGVANGALLLIVTVSKAKQDGILKVIEDEFPNGCAYILLHHIPEFGRWFHPPKLLDIYNTHWERCKHSQFKFK